MKNTIIIIITLLLTPLIGFPQSDGLHLELRIVSPVDTIIPLYYLNQDTVGFKVFPDSAGMCYFEIPQNFISNEAIIAIQSGEEMCCLSTISQLKKNRVIKKTGVELAMVRLKRQKLNPMKQRIPYKHFYKKRGDGIPFDSIQRVKIDSIYETSKLDADSLAQMENVLLVADTQADSSFCIPFLPHHVGYGSYVSNTNIDSVPFVKAEPKLDTMESLKCKICSYYNRIKNQEVAKGLDLGSIILIIDEKGHLRGLYSFIIEPQKELDLHFASLLFDFCKPIQFIPAKTIEGWSVSDVVEIPLRGCVSCQ